MRFRITCSLLAVSALVLASCASGDEGASDTAPAAVAFDADVPTPTPPSGAPAGTTPPPTAPDPAVTNGGSTVNATGDLPSLPDADTAAALVSSLLETPEGRALVARGLAEQSGISREAADCFVTAIGTDTLIAMTSLGVDASPADLVSLPADTRAEILQIVATCGITPETLLG